MPIIEFHSSAEGAPLTPCFTYAEDRDKLGELVHTSGRSTKESNIQPNQLHIFQE